MFDRFLARGRVRVVLMIFSGESFRLSNRVMNSVSSCVSTGCIGGDREGRCPIQDEDGTHVERLPRRTFCRRVLRERTRSGCPLRRSAKLTRPYVLSTSVSLRSRLTGVNISFRSGLFRLVSRSRLSGGSI